MTAGEHDIGEKALGKVAELGVASQLDEVEDLSIDVSTDPGKLIQGKVDSVDISGKGLVAAEGLRIESLEVSVGNVEVNPINAIFNNFELTSTANADAQIVLSEADINTALSSDYVQNKLRNVALDVDGRCVIVDVQSTVQLPGDNKLMVTADLLLKEEKEVKKLSATVIPQVEENGHCISLEILSAGGQGLTVGFAIAILNKLETLLDLRTFNIPGMALQLRRLEAQAGKLVIYANTEIEQIPFT